jgi:hypothetical protein
MHALLQVQHDDRDAEPSFSSTEGIITGRKRMGSVAMTKNTNCHASPAPAKP